MIKPLKKLKSLAAGAGSLGQDRGHPASRKTPARIPSNATGSLPFEQSIGDGSERNDLLSCRVFGMRTQTCQQTASTSGNDCLTSLFRFAKRKIRANPTDWYFHRLVEIRRFRCPERHGEAVFRRKTPRDWRSRSS